MISNGWTCPINLLKSPSLSLALYSWRTRAISTELTTALRPFYFVVHPDLFGQHPKQRSVNEESLKQLSAHIESLYEQRYHVLNETKTLQFYIRDNNEISRDSFKLIQITLDKRLKEPKTLIEKLLLLCNLPTEYIKNVKTTETKRTTVNATTQQKTGANYSASGDYNYGNGFNDFEYKYNKVKKSMKKSLEDWITANADLARTRADGLNGLKVEVAKLQVAVVKRLGLLDARYDCGWNFEHYRGCLKTLERLANMHEEQMAVLRGRIVVFAPFTGVSIEGHIMLFTGDVLNNWMDFIKNIPQQDEFLKRIPAYENTLSQVLRNIKIGRRKFMPKQQVMEYASHLMKVTTTLGDYLTANNFPKVWPASLRNYEIVVESEAGPLMVSPTGQLITPATCPGFMLVDFITTNMELAQKLMTKYQEEKHIEKELMERCIRHLELKTLSKDDSVTPEKMIGALEMLLKLESRVFVDLDLHITNYYSVLTDGLVCIPWDFVAR